jgi:hypothetical protein
MFWDNIRRRIVAASIQLLHAEKPGISNLAKSSYYRSASIILSTVVEGLVYHLAEKRIGVVGGGIYELVEYKQVHKIPMGALGLGHELFFCKRERRDVGVTEIGATFDKLNQYLKKDGTITRSEFKELDWVRKERNRLHIQGLDSTDIGYTKAKVDRISNPISFLTTIIKAHP